MALGAVTQVADTQAVAQAVLTERIKVAPVRRTGPGRGSCRRILRLGHRAAFPYRNSHTSFSRARSISRHRPGCVRSVRYERAMAPTHMSASCTRRSRRESMNLTDLTQPVGN